MLIISSGSTCTIALDLGVAVDVSTSVKERNLQPLRDALYSLVNVSDISSNGTHMGLILFGGRAELRFNFSDAKFHNPAAIREEISEVKNLISGTRTHNAMVLANKKLFTSAGGDRPDKRNVLLVLTDGKPKGKKDFTQVTGDLKVSQSTTIPGWGRTRCILCPSTQGPRKQGGWTRTCKLGGSGGMLSRKMFEILVP